MGWGAWLGADYLGRYSIMRPRAPTVGQYAIAFLDYSCMICLYIPCAFVLAGCLNGGLFPSFEAREEAQQSLMVTFCRIVTQLATQGLLVFAFVLFMQRLGSPFQGRWDYDAQSSIGNMVRGPAVFSMLVFSLSSSLRERIAFFFDRFAASLAAHGGGGGGGGASKASAMAAGITTASSGV